MSEPQHTGLEHLSNAVFSKKMNDVAFLQALAGMGGTPMTLLEASRRIKPHATHRIGVARGKRGQRRPWLYLTINQRAQLDVAATAHAESRRRTSIPWWRTRIAPVAIRERAQPYRYDGVLYCMMHAPKGAVLLSDGVYKMDGSPLCSVCGVALRRTRNEVSDGEECGAAAAG